MKAPGRYTKQRLTLFDPFWWWSETQNKTHADKQTKRKIGSLTDEDLTLYYPSVMSQLRQSTGQDGCDYYFYPG